MTLAELEALIQEAYAQGLTPDTEVVIGSQPNYPFGCSLSGFCVDHTYSASLHGEHAPRTVLVLTEGRQQTYGNQLWWSGEGVIEAEPEEFEED